MTTFNDSQGREWSIEVNSTTIAAVRNEGYQWFMAGWPARTFDKLDVTRDCGETLVNVLWVLCREQADAAGISPEDFGRSLVGDGIDMAVSAFVEACLAFLPHKKRAVFARLLSGWENRCLEHRNLKSISKEVNNDERG